MEHISILVQESIRVINDNSHVSISITLVHNAMHNATTERRQLHMKENITP